MHDRARPRRPARAALRRATSSAALRATPTTCRFAPAGLVSGPSTLKIVRTPSSLRTGPTARIAGWWRRANRNAMPRLAQQLRRGLGSRSISHAQRFEHVGAAALARCRAVAVFGDRDAAAGDDQRRRGRDVDRAGAVAAGADDVEHERQPVLDAHAALAHRARRADDLVGRLALGGERGKERGRAHRRDRLVHDRADHARRHLCGARDRSRRSRDAQQLRDSRSSALRARRGSCARAARRPA